MSFEVFPTIKKPELFSAEEKVFLNEKLQEMHGGVLVEEEFELGIDSKGNKYGLYKKEEIEKDKAEVVRIKKDFEINDKAKELEATNFSEQQKIMETSRYLEALFYEKLGGKNGWLPNAAVYKTSEYDDFKNGIDFVVELDEEHFGIAIDVTLSRRSEIIINKLKKVKTRIDHDKLTEVKYYELPGHAENGTVPSVVIALDYNHAVQALKFWADGDDELLAKHPTRVKAWLEASAQFDAYRTYAEYQSKHSIAEVYKRAYGVIQKIINENQDTIQKYQSVIEEDQAYQTIMGFCEDLKTKALKPVLL